MPMPTKYRPEMCKTGRKLALLGATDREIADFFEVHESNLRDWYAKHPEFGSAIRAGKMLADARVAQALYLNALKGNVMAQMYWLNNRSRANWRQRQDVELTGPNGGPVKVDGAEPGKIAVARAVAFAMAEGAELVKRAQQSGNAAAQKAKEKA